jgi:ABC-type multidrug transport system ATPase subunit
MNNPEQINAFEAVNVTFRYNDVTALDDLSVSIERNKRIAILGANGSGKSTFLRLLDGLYFPDKGTISAFGENLTEEAFADDEFAFAFAAASRSFFKTRTFSFSIRRFSMKSRLRPYSFGGQKMKSDAA